MRIGIVCPYSFDVPGGVQNHVLDLAGYLIRLGHEVSVLAPAAEHVPLPDFVVPAGRAVPVSYNGSVARLNFGFLSAARVRRWLQDGEFDVLHVHEPGTPSLSLLALWAASGPTVATFHTSMSRSRWMTAAYPILQPALEKLNARIAVSEYARRTQVEHLGGDAVVIPNGVDVAFFAKAATRPEWSTPEGQDDGGTLAFVGRSDEPRKGLATLLDAFPAIVAARPATRLLVLGRGDTAEATARVPAELRDQVTFLGALDDRNKAELLRSVDVYVAPNLGGESFGIILVEAMSAGTPVLASDLDAFRQVLDNGKAGELFGTGDPAALARAAIGLLADPDRRAALAATASALVMRYDWATVAADILTVYETITDRSARVATENRPSSFGRFGLGRLTREQRPVGWDRGDGDGAPPTRGGSW
jgi:phosphatidyl-myo-inositol alpha-mannosyltransferase